MKRRNWLRTLIALAAGRATAGIPLSEEPKPACLPTPILELGPYPAMKYRGQPDHDVDLTRLAGQRGKAAGKVMIVQGKVTDMNCKPLAGAVVEIWSANHYGRYRHEFDQSERQDDLNFQGWGQAITNTNGEYRFKTILPGLYGSRARHIHFKVSKRGYHERVTQLFFEGDERHKTDGILNCLNHEEQLQIIRPLVINSGMPTVLFTITLDKVQYGNVPEKMLREYVGRYAIRTEGKGFDEWARYIPGFSAKNIIMELTVEGAQLFMTLPFSPKTEVFRHAEDEFGSWAFYNTYLLFQRNAEGKVVGLHLHPGEDKYLEGVKL
nr:intradiol ring-cleavage dioxygenase [uncultured Arsenicibacter sp.]